MTTRFFGDTAVLLGRSLRHIGRSPDTIVTTAITPVAMMLMFVYVFVGAIDQQRIVAELRQPPRHDRACRPPTENAGFGGDVRRHGTLELLSAAAGALAERGAPGTLRASSSGRCAESRT